jgi:uncharacterized protein (TIGR03435 family)
MRIALTIAMAVLLPATTVPLPAQSDPPLKSFEVASVKLLPQPAPGTSSGGGPGTSDPGRWWRSNVTMASLFVQAFHIQGHAIVAPDWLTAARYDIAARVPAGATRDDIPLMIQRLLIDRFGLTFHREQKEMQAYTLVTAKSGPKLIASAANPASIHGRDGFADLADGVAPGAIQVDSVGPVRRLAAGAMSMPEFADYLAGQSELPVVDLTELPGKYDIVLYYSRPAPISANPQAAADNGLDLFSALREQLGLELHSRKTRVNVLVVDHIEQTPSPN